MSRTNNKEMYIDKFHPTVNFITNILPVRNENIITQIASENIDQYRTFNNSVIGNKIPKKSTAAHSRNNQTPGQDISHMYNTADGVNDVSPNELPKVRKKKRTIPKLQLDFTNAGTQGSL
jgi:hypothetical protein